MREDIPVKLLSVSTSHLIPAVWQTEADKMIKGMLKVRVIELATKAGRWCLPSKFVSKPGDVRRPDGSPCLRHVIDYTHLN